MPTISQFFGIVIQIFWRAHAPLPESSRHPRRVRGADRRPDARSHPWRPSQTRTEPHIGTGDPASSRIDGALDPVSIQAAAETHRPVGVTPAAPWRLSALSRRKHRRPGFLRRDVGIGAWDLRAPQRPSVLRPGAHRAWHRHLAERGRPRSCLDARPTPPRGNVVCSLVDPLGALLFGM